MKCGCRLAQILDWNEIAGFDANETNFLFQRDSLEAFLRSLADICRFEHGLRHADVSSDNMKVSVFEFYAESFTRTGFSAQILA